MSSSRKVCVTAADGNTGFLIAELILKHRDFSRKVSGVVGLALDPDSDHAKELKELGATIVRHEPGRLRVMIKALKETGCDTICLVPPAHEHKIEICEDAGFYAENLLLYAPQAKEEGILPLPIGEKHKFAPVALGDVAHVAAHVVTGKGKHGFDDKHRGQMMVVTGPTLCAGKELAAAASKALGTELQFEHIAQAEAKKVLKAHSDIDKSEQQYILEYYSLVREGKTNYVATTAFHDVTGEHPTEAENFFQMYQSEMRPKKKAKHEHKG
ncbi:hypothetical protein LRP88_02405 [Fusarium phalaenopsidis]